MKTYLLILIVWVAIPCFGQTTIPISFNNPPLTPQLFGELSISTLLNERDFAISPDGKELYYTVSTPKSTFQTIVFSKQLSDGVWSAPQVVSFGGQFSDLEPALSADGKTLYFASNRPITGTQTKDFDIWKVNRVGAGWGKPENLGLPINTESDEFYPSIAKSGNLYFTATYPGGVGKEDIYVSRLANQLYQKPLVLDTAINTRLYEFNAFVSPDETYILFTGYGRRDDMGGGDLYLSIKDAQGNWKPARNLKALNSRQLDYCPYVSPDGKALYFTSERHQLPTSFVTEAVTFKSIQSIYSNPLNGTGNIYWVNFQKILKAQ